MICLNLAVRASPGLLQIRTVALPVAARMLSWPDNASSACSNLPSPRAGGVRTMKMSRSRATMEDTYVCSEADAVEYSVPEAVKAPVERRPAFHLAPAGGWINDPNGPLLHNGTYHLFYQHVPNSRDWQWGLVWGHAKSRDLVNWEHLPAALEPTPDSPDRHGCFSGCATLDVDGRPALLYTGVVRKTPDEIEPGISPQHESQIIAVPADPEDPDLKDWLKLPGSFLPQPPADMDLTGWRDPFVLERPSSNGSPWWYVMIGAGVRNKCGTALVYRSQDLKAGWEYVGPLCESPSSTMWECPIMAQLSNQHPTSHVLHSDKAFSNGHTLNTVAASSHSHEIHKRHLFSVSPDYCINPIQHWLGDYAAGKFDMANADGPFRLDLGDIMYAPNVLTDKHGRTVLWAWMQEKEHIRPAGPYNSSCCLCVPRVLYLSPDGKTLKQEPLPELRELRQQGVWQVGAAAASLSNGNNGHSSATVPLLPSERLHLGMAPSGGLGSSTSSIDLEVTIARGDAESVVLLLHPFEGAQGAAGAGISYCWSTNTLQVIYSTDIATLERTAALPIAARPYHKQGGPSPIEVAEAEAAEAEQLSMPMRCGGALHGSSSSSSSSGGAGDVLSLRVLLDGSCLEVFTGCGHALATRVYRGDESPVCSSDSSADAGLQLNQQDTFLNGSTAAAAMAAAAAEGAVGWEQLFRRPLQTSTQPLRGGHLELVSFGGAAELLSGSAWQMSSMWQQQLQQQKMDEEAVAAATAPVASVALPVPAANAVTAAATEVLQGLVAAEVAAVAAVAAVTPVILPMGELSLDVIAVAAAGSSGGEAFGAAMELLPLSPSSGQVAVNVEAA